MHNKETAYIPQPRVAKQSKTAERPYTASQRERTHAPLRSLQTCLAWFTGPIAFFVQRTERKTAQNQRRPLHLFCCVVYGNEVQYLNAQSDKTGRSL